MTAATGGYVRQLATFTTESLAQLVGAPSHSRRAIAARRLSRDGTLLVAGCGLAILVLMLFVDVPTIGAMPRRGAASQWPVRILTDFARPGYVLQTTGALVLIIVFVVPLLQGVWRSLATALGARISFIFMAVAVPNLVTECLKGFIGRGRPFVGGAANAFNYSPLTWSEQFASLPSSHAVTGFALAFAVSAVWPRTRYIMAFYALLMALSRIVLLAHHPSDVVAGALVGVVGAMFVRQWFAARRLGFVIGADGRIYPLRDTSFARLKGMAMRPKPLRTET